MVFFGQLAVFLSLDLFCSMAAEPASLEHPNTLLAARVCLQV